MAKKGGLGMGLGALVSQSAKESGLDEMADKDASVKEVAIGEVHRNPNQPRTKFDQEDLDELSASIKEVGIIQPIVVRKDTQGYEIIAGERRYQAACAAGLENVPVVVRDDTDDITSLQLALIENIQRADLNVIEEARAYRDLIERSAMTQEELAKSVSKSRSAIANVLRLLELPDEVQEMVYTGQLSAGHARAILMAKGDEARIALAHRVVNEKMTVRIVEAIAPTFTGEEKPVRQKVQIPASYKKAAKTLKEGLGTPVRIKESKGKYRIEIDFENEEHLEQLMAMIQG